MEERQTLKGLIAYNNGVEQPKDHIYLIHEGKNYSIIRQGLGMFSNIQVYKNEYTDCSKCTPWMDNRRKPWKLKLRNAYKQLERIEKGLNPTNQPRRVNISLVIER